MSDEFRLPIGEVIDKRWQLNKLLGAGAFGAVYEVIDLADVNRPTYALKLEKNNLKDRSMNLLKLEVTVLRYLREAKAKHCPGYVSCGQAPQYNFVVMGLVGKSVSETRKMMPNRRFTLRTCLHIGIEGVKSIDEIHQVG
uniref:Protein kinase domain-containing protein n=1 Tax=Romanomermis culicivorax TaxID=13658 RepID=A0A915I4R3_ROMCU